MIRGPNMYAPPQQDYEAAALKKEVKRFLNLAGVVPHHVVAILVSLVVITAYGMMVYLTFSDMWF